MLPQQKEGYLSKHPLFSTVVYNYIGVLQCICVYGEKGNNGSTVTERESDEVAGEFGAMSCRLWMG